MLEVDLFGFIQTVSLSKQLTDEDSSVDLQTGTKTDFMFNKVERNIKEVSKFL